jgi:hypothetical protein
MQLQRDIGIFRGIVCRPLQLDLIETDLRRTFAADVFKADGFLPRWRSARLSMLCDLCDSKT